MITQTDFAPVAALDLDRIITKLCHVESGEGWSRARADAAAVEYRRFLYLVKAFPAEQTVPSVEVDTFWHYHILDTMKYAADCAAVFGFFLHHDPAVGLDEHDAPERLDGAARMDTLYAATFGARLGSADASAYGGRDVSYCGWVGPTAATRTQAASYCGWVGPTAAPGSPAASYCGWVGPSATRPATAAIA